MQSRAGGRDQITDVYCASIISHLEMICYIWDYSEEVIFTNPKILKFE